MFWKSLILPASTFLLLFALAGCQTHEFAQAGIPETQRDADSKKCFAEAREAIEEQRPPAGATSDQVIVTSAFNGYAKGKAMGKYRNECMVRLGYERVPLD